jgi:hypothetical protein
MSSLTAAPLAALLEALLKEDEESEIRFADLSLSNEEMDLLMGSKTDYLDFYGRLKDFPLAVSRRTGALIYMLARSCRAREIVEFGT